MGRKKAAAVLEQPEPTHIGEIVHAVAERLTQPEESPQSRAAEVVKTTNEAMGDPNAVALASTLPEPEKTSFASREEPPREEGQSHAEAVGKRSTREPGYLKGFTDKVIGAHRLEHVNPYLSIIKLDEKPSEEVRTKLREDGFTWSPKNTEWKRPINYDTRQQDRESARRTFDEVCKMIRTERGITHGYGSPS